MGVVAPGEKENLPMGRKRWCFVALVPQLKRTCLSLCYVIVKQLNQKK